MSRWHTARTAALTIGGLGSLTGAAWTAGLGYGLAAAGISLLLLEWLTRPAPPPADTTPRRRP